MTARPWSRKAAARRNLAPSRLLRRAIRSRRTARPTRSPGRLPLLPHPTRSPRSPGRFSTAATASCRASVRVACRMSTGPRRSRPGRSSRSRFCSRGSPATRASVERLRREATIAMRLDHPNVCPILRLGESPERLIYLVMPFLEGEPLSEHESRRGPVLRGGRRAAPDPDVPRAPARARAADHPPRPQAREHHAGAAGRAEARRAARNTGPW